MPFLAPALPFLLQAGTTIGASAIANKLGGGAQTTPLQDKVFQQQLEAGKLGMDTARQLLPQGQNIIKMGTGALQQPANYWSSILSGNRGLMTSALAPEISRIGQGYQTAQNASAALMPRGGPSAEFNAELPFQQQRDISTLMQQARPQAASNLFNVGQGLGQLGQGLIGSGISSIYGATAAGRDIIQQQQQAQAAAAERGKAIGTGLFDLINKFDFGSIFKGNKPQLGGGPGFPTYPFGQGDYGPGF